MATIFLKGGALCLEGRGVCITKVGEGIPGQTEGRGECITKVGEGIPGQTECLKTQSRWGDIAQKATG